MNALQWSLVAVVIVLAGAGVWWYAAYRALPVVPASTFAPPPPLNTDQGMPDTGVIQTPSSE